MIKELKHLSYEEKVLEIWSVTKYKPFTYITHFQLSASNQTQEEKSFLIVLSENLFVVINFGNIFVNLRMLKP